MFRKNTKHQQPALISATSELPEKQRQRLENSMAGTLTVRGKFRIACLMIASAATANVRRIQRYLMTKMKTAKAPSSL
jgi:hypothetical protein